MANPMNRKRGSSAQSSRSASKSTPPSPSSVEPMEVDTESTTNSPRTAVSGSITLKEWDTEPLDYNTSILTRGYVLLESSYEMPDWGKIREREYVPAVKNKLVHVPNANLDYLVGVAKLDSDQFSDVLLELFHKKWHRFSSDSEISYSDLPKPDTYVYRLGGSLVLSGNFVDNIQAGGTNVEGYRLLWFNKSTRVKLARFPKETFARTRNLYFGGIHKITSDPYNGTLVFGKDAFTSKYGDSGTLKIEPHQVLVLPAPSSFHPINEGRETLMGTMLIPLSGNLAPLTTGPELTLCFSATLFHGRQVDSEVDGIDETFPEFLNEEDLQAIRKSTSGSFRMSPGKGRNEVFLEVNEKHVVIYPPERLLTKTVETLRKPFPNQAEIPTRDEFESRRDEVRKAVQERSKATTSTGLKGKGGRGQKKGGGSGRKLMQKRKSTRKVDESEEEGSDGNRKSVKSSKRPRRERSPSV